MIIIGFPCIGKSSVTNENISGYTFSGFVDLESSNFEKDEAWVREYGNVALDLSGQGYDVFVSSHKAVRDYLSQFQDNEDIIEVFPNAELHDTWIDRLANRYKNDPSDKNKKAYEYISNNFYTAVDEMHNDDIKLKLILHKDSYINDLNREIGIFCTENGL